ncbi:hypothetical protein KHM83_09740 [Fusibacter paucivorans]|uniref:Uncharacterized protein n=1 Tax=Fusibacter paucivorans TaxID=76009 RepID=A0ABS5PP69_9FIRM|nr:hypothetical protein [Fusibacter paucivorans]MBS7526960.1 hypothetical protein [Fusibacter paucivorans]
MSYRKVGLILIALSIIAMFFGSVVPIDPYVRVALTTFMLGSGVFLIFFKGYDDNDMD